jgi:hypothetical protein
MCKHLIRMKMNMVRYRECTRPAIEDGYCRQHNPEAVAERARQRHAVEMSKSGLNRARYFAKLTRQKRT